LNGPLGLVLITVAAAVAAAITKVLPAVLAVLAAGLQALLALAHRGRQIRAAAAQAQGMFLQVYFLPAAAADRALSLFVILTRTPLRRLRQAHLP